MNTNLLTRFRDPALARELLGDIEQLTARLLAARPEISAERPLRLMEVCGTHTVAIARAGLRELLPPEISLISGPGCPVCVTANRDIDRLIACTRLPHVTVATFGDMLRVPGSSSSLALRKAEGAAVEVVYSPLDALKHAVEDPGRQIVFAGVGFETTTPLIAATIKRAAAGQVSNFSVLAMQKQVPPAIAALLADPEVALDALILPGHVSTILGTEPYRFIASEHGIPGVITGFEPADILWGIAQLLRQLWRRTPEIQIAYERGVRPEGNPVARVAIAEVFEPADAIWRGLGAIPRSGSQIRSTYTAYDAAHRFELEVEQTVEPRGCRCGEVLRGVLAPDHCALFGRACTPQDPIGPCMVSSEGSCAAYFRYQIHDRVPRTPPQQPAQSEDGKR
ncbi:MAG: hydrogenase formation protein HypD [Coriobacteriales bacterium]|jgi:hydrogenase expression/formation protein HypD|nr:hydrogenase formation protein HypD [Coriobacteriales bacterium]